MVKKVIKDDDTISGEQLAGIIGITSRRIRQLAGEGHIDKMDNARYPYPKAVRQYCEYLKNCGNNNLDALKIKDMEIKCELGKQKIEARKREIMEDIANQCWDIFLDILSPMKTELVRADLPPEIESEWNGIIERAVESARKRKGQGILDAESQTASD